MKVAIVGTKDRNTKADRAAVGELVELIAAAHFDVKFIATDTWNDGIGCYVRDKCLEKTGKEFRFKLILADFRSYSHDLTRTEITEIYLARNAGIFELADMLYYFAVPDRRGTLEDLVGRMTQAGRPVHVLLPGEPVTLYKGGA